MTFFSKINKFSQNVFKYIVIAGFLIIILGILLLERYTFYSELFIARKMLETGFCFFPLAIILSFITDYLYKKTAS